MIALSYGNPRWAFGKLRCTPGVSKSIVGLLRNREQNQIQ